MKAISMKEVGICADCGGEFVRYAYERYSRCPRCRSRRFTEEIKKGEGLK